MMKADVGSSPTTYFQLFEKIFFFYQTHNTTLQAQLLFDATRQTHARELVLPSAQQACSTWSSPSLVQAGARRASRRPRVCPGAAESASGSTCGWASASSPWAAGTELLWSRRSTSSSIRWDAGRIYFGAGPILTMDGGQIYLISFLFSFFFFFYTIVQNFKLK